MKRKIRSYSGALTPSISEREQKNRTITRTAATEGIVLLKNEGLLPLKPDCKVGLFGSGAGQTIKGGTGSGDVNERECVNIYQGFVNAGIQVVSSDWIEDFQNRYIKSREDWKAAIFKEMEGKDVVELFQIYSNHTYKMPQGRDITDTDLADADVLFYVVSRTAGEAADRFDQAGDYYLTEHEKEDLHILAASGKDMAIIINTGGQIDMQDILAIPNVKAIVNLSQAGMEGGNALGDIITGAVTPSGKLTDTWAKNYSDFPNSATFSHNNGNVTTETYEEGLYVGYRYFDSFEMDVEYPFGYGLSYTDFAIHTEEICTKENNIHIKVTVTNTGNIYSGKEVVQIYASCPQGTLPKEYKRLCGYTKTKLLAPQESETLTLTIPADALASFSEEASAWILEKGLYGIWIGNSSRNVTLEGILSLENETILETVSSICPLQEDLEEIIAPNSIALEENWHKTASEKELIPIPFAPKATAKVKIAPNAYDEMAETIVNQLSDEELIYMVIGEISKGQENAIGAAGIMVPGAAGETSGILEEKFDIPGISMADGPAGLRLIKKYSVDRETKEIYGIGLLAALEGGYFATPEVHENADTYYQYCTAFPVGTMLAQTWNTDILEMVGQAVAEEMQEFGVAWWLAPGMNIHRNPLCGRNFEYYSEDPLLTGMTAAAITRGVQSIGGVGTTIKHFACNNQEDNRMGSNSVISERVLREIYLKGFEIAVKTAQPMAIMTSYNLINGVHAPNSKDLCTTIAREEWDFQGIIMTDWTTTFPSGGSSSWKCAYAGNDLIMPGFPGDIEDIRKALESGELSRDDLKSCVKRLLKVIYQTLGYEDRPAYGAQFETMKPYVIVERQIKI